MFSVYHCDNEFCDESNQNTKFDLIKNIRLGWICRRIWDDLGRWMEYESKEKNAGISQTNVSFYRLLQKWQLMSISSYKL